MRALLLALAAASLLGLAACGKKGPPQPPGPPDRITFPRTYPTE
jgi:predicted small lipoprotein YifL